MSLGNLTVSLFGVKRHVRPIGVPLCIVLMIPALLLGVVYTLALFVLGVVYKAALFVLMVPPVAVGFLFAEPR